MRRKLFALITAVLLLISMTVPAFADMVPYGSTVPAGRLYLVSSLDCDSSSMSVSILGHAFLVYKNTSSLTVPVGNWEVEPGDEITFGVTGAEGVDNVVWYNLEAYYYHSGDDFDTSIYTWCDVTYGDMLAVGAVIDQWVIYSALNSNCVHFSLDVWNSVSYIGYDGILPSELGQYIRNHCTYGTNYVFEEQTLIGYYRPDNGLFTDVY